MRSQHFSFSHTHRSRSAVRPRTSSVLPVPSISRSPRLILLLYGRQFSQQAQPSLKLCRPSCLRISLSSYRRTTDSGATTVAMKTTTTHDPAYSNRSTRHGAGASLSLCSLALLSLCVSTRKALLRPASAIGVTGAPMSHCWRFVCPGTRGMAPYSHSTVFHGVGKWESTIRTMASSLLVMVYHALRSWRL